MAAVGGPNYTNALKEADARTGVAPLDIPCERFGGESRRESLKEGLMTLPVLPPKYSLTAHREQHQSKILEKFYPRLAM